MEKFNLDNINFGKLLKKSDEQGGGRKKELQEKTNNGIITVEEEAELQGLCAFPDNSHGAELRIREILGTITTEEKEELRRLNQLKTRQEKNSPELQDLWKRVEANDLNVEQVSMNQGKSVEVLPTDKDEKVIWTYGLLGCLGALVFSEEENGKKTAILTHYDPLSISRNVDDLKNLISLNSSIKKAKYKQTVLVLAAGDYKQNQETGQYENVVQDQQKADMLVMAVKKELGDDVEIKIEPYSTLRSFNKKDEGVLMVRVPPNGQATYKTWFSQGKLGKIIDSEDSK